MDHNEYALMSAAGDALTPFLIEHHLRSGASVERVCQAASTDQRLWVLALLHAELPAMAEEAAVEVARRLYGDQADSALRFLAAQTHAQANAALANAALASTAQEIRDRLALAVSG